jgi:drug/metabolite transporter (DMT)-like permease
VSGTEVVRAPSARDTGLLALAVLAVSTSGPLIAAIAAPALAIAFWRCLLGAGATGGVVLARGRHELVSLRGRAGQLSIVSGLLLAAHFATWIPSLRYTSVAASTALVATQPVWAALIARLRGQHIPSRAWVGIAISLVGVVVLTGIDISLDHRALIGDSLALIGAVMAAAYVSVGERARQTVPTGPYTLVVYSMAAVALLVTCVLAHASLVGYTLHDWLLIIALTLLAQLLGHSLINRLLKTVSATVVSLGILFEMPGATILAWIFLGQKLPLALLPALLLLMAGLAVVVGGLGARAGLVEEPPV